jgi:hypothetical protein
MGDAPSLPARPAVASPEGRASPRLVLVLARFVAILVITWLVVRWTLPLWAAAVIPLAEGALRTAEPWPLTTEVRLRDDGVTLQFFHVYANRVPKTPTVDLLSLTYGVPLWFALCLAVPGVPWRSRLRDLALGWVVLVVASMVALVARVHHVYATIDADPFPALFDNWRGWTAYFIDMFFLEVGFFVLPLGLALLFHRRQWAAFVLRLVPVIPGSAESEKK